MNDRYISPDPAAEINGTSLRVALAAFQIEQQARSILVRHGLPEEPQAGSWYPLQAWLDVLADMEARFGAQTVYAAGLQVIRHSLWPAHLQTLPQALGSLQQAHQSNVRGKEIGYYRAEEQGPQAMRVECFTPVPLNFDHGIITGVARKFRPAGSLRVQVVPEPPQATAPAGLKRFSVSW
ncbi:hypothetical protein [Hymenobacter sp. DG01]|uniref:hypothetical protein n=1 Tax=Hymenobacter sp. DG01 TaxID=2584940 RepID=UPI0011241C66|nr:hypothetical protein [Hymenobacter sp. DG01]